MRKILYATVAITFISTSVFAKVPNVLAYEQILKGAIVKPPPGLALPNTTTMSPPPPLPAPLAMPNNVGQEKNDAFNVIGVMSIAGKNSAWLINKDNKLIRVAPKVEVEGKTITEITGYGAYYKDGAGQKGFMPVITPSVNEKDIEFESTFNSNKTAPQSAGNTHP
ncbi:MAG: hypothetical protein WCW84_06855 [Sulfurimonas sp.]|jgi:hypothetical protein